MKKFKMKCDIKYVGKKRNGIPQYYCSIHKSNAFDKKGNKLEECLCNYKEIFANDIDIKKTKVENIKIIYTNILENPVPTI